MFPRTFFRPSVWTVSMSIALTLLAAVMLYMTLICALDGRNGCQTPLALQIFMIVAVWPTVIVFRVLNGIVESGLIGIIGVVLSGLWIYTVVCAVRALAHLRRS